MDKSSRRIGADDDDDDDDTPMQSNEIDPLRLSGARCAMRRTSDDPRSLSELTTVTAAAALAVELQGIAAWFGR